MPVQRDERSEDETRGEERDPQRRKRGQLGDLGQHSPKGLQAEKSREGRSFQGTPSFFACFCGKIKA